MAPLGICIILHEKPNQHRTWAPHGLNWWYISYAPKHYRCYMVYVMATSATQITDTIKLFLQHCTMPKTSSSDAAIFTAQDLIHALQHPAPAPRLSQLGSEQAHSLQQLANIFERAMHPSREL
jgi:hypothetical protein